ncbi:MAG: hypothetical protein WC860_09965 [Candidatus Margulisiibacteriota bacterium]|jgi:hypothetical protein
MEIKRINHQNKKSVYDEKWYEQQKKATGKQKKHEQINSLLEILARSNSPKANREQQYKELLKHKAEIDQSARKDGNAHEVVNAATTTTFVARTALGLNPNMERNAKAKNGTTIPITHMSRNQTIPTEQLLTKPKKIGELSKTIRKAIPEKSHQQYVLAGHTGAAYIEDENGKKTKVIPTEMASRSGIHTDQLAAQEK